ncbi:hypothetical protein, partial [Desulfurobacterium sp.]
YTVFILVHLWVAKKKKKFSQSFRQRSKEATVNDSKINELVLKHEREISQLTAMQEILVKQTERATETLEALKDALGEIKLSIEEQRKELKVAIEIRDKLDEFTQNFLIQKNSQEQTNHKLFEKIEALDGEVEGLKQEIKKLS